MIACRSLGCTPLSSGVACPFTVALICSFFNSIQLGGSYVGNHWGTKFMKKTDFLLPSRTVKLTLDVKGEKKVTAADIKTNADVEVINPDQHIATITEKKTEFSVEIDIEKGIGYVPVEQRQKEKLAIGAIAIDAIFSPVQLVNFKIENVRVGQRIDFNKITMDVETDGSIQPEAAMKKAAEILIDHFRVVSEVMVPEVVAKKEPKTRKKSAK